MTNVDRTMIEARKNLAKEMKAQGKKKGYRSRYREMEMLVQKHANER